MHVNQIPDDRFHLFTGDLLKNAADDDPDSHTDHSYTYTAPTPAAGVNGTALSSQLGNDFDIVTANILADIIIPLSGVIRPHLADGGLYISSGIIDTRAEEVADALRENGFTILAKETLGEWVCFVCR